MTEISQSRSSRTAAVLTVSDSASRGNRVDISGPATADVLRQNGFEVLFEQVVSDDQRDIETEIVRLCDLVQLVVTTGGTGIADRDVTPEATRAVCSKLIEGIGQKMRQDGLSRTPFAVLSRGVCGVRGHSLVLNLPGSPNGAVESLRAVLDVLPHAIDLLAGRTAHPAEPSR